MVFIDIQVIEKMFIDADYCSNDIIEVFELK